MKRKILALFLTTLLVVMMLPMSASARGWDGNPDSLTYGVITVKSGETYVIESGEVLNVSGTLRVENGGTVIVRGELNSYAPKSYHPSVVREDSLGLTIDEGGKVVVKDGGYLYLHSMSTYYMVGYPLADYMPAKSGLKGDIVVESGGWFDYDNRFQIGYNTEWTENGVLHISRVDGISMDRSKNTQITVNFGTARTATGLGYVGVTVNQGIATAEYDFVPELVTQDDIAEDKLEGHSLKSKVPIRIFVEDGATFNGYDAEEVPSQPVNPDPEPDPEPVIPSKYFSDVTADAWYCNAAEYVYEHGIMAGTADGIFEPNATLNRAQAVQILYNLEGQPTAAESAGYVDTTGHWAINAINWASEKAIVSGVGNNRFDPNSPVSREQFAVMMYNYAQYKGYDLSAQADLTTFPDNGKVSSWAQRAMQWANGEGLINGSDGSLLPGGTTTRAQAASILMKFDQSVVGN